MEQIERQIAIEAKYVDFITGYEFLSMMEPPESTLKLGGDGAVHLLPFIRKYPDWKKHRSETQSLSKPFQ